MKYFTITLALLLGAGCSNIGERPDYIGTLPYYANKAPHPINCACCGELRGQERTLDLLELEDFPPTPSCDR